MIKKRKIEVVNNLQKILNENNNIYFVDISNMNANHISNLRRSFFKENVKMYVVKNTLLKKSINLVKNKKINSFYTLLNGNTSIIISINNNAPAKIIKKFRESNKYKRPLIKCAYINESLYLGDESLDILANIKSKEEMIIDIINNLYYQYTYLIYSLQNNNQKLLIAINNIINRIHK